MLTLNLRNRMILRSAAEAAAEAAADQAAEAAADQAADQAADFLDKKRVGKRSWGHSAGKSKVNDSETEGHKIKPHKLRNWPDHECALVHCEGTLQRLTRSPLKSSGETANGFPFWRQI